MGVLFGTSGVRGVVGEQVTPQLAIGLGSALAAYLGNSGAVAIGKDPRTSSDMLEGCFISGLLSGGCNVKRLGMVPTPVVGFATKRLGVKAGVMVTASHNPPEYNGFKLFDSDGMAYTTSVEGKIENLYFKKKWKKATWADIGKIEKADIVQDYIGAFAGETELSREYKVIVDCGNGAATFVAPLALEKIGCKVVPINSQPDGLFPGRPLEPSAENLGELCKMVRSNGADLGIAHDGDADRVAVVDEKGTVAFGDELLALVAASQISAEKSIVVTTVDASRVVDEVVGNRDGTVVRTKVGDVSVATEVKRIGAAFGGEPCGAWIFPGFSMVPDGLLGAVKVLKLLSDSGKNLSELLGPLPDYYTARKKVACPDEKKAKVMSSLPKRLEGAFEEAIELTRIDGVRLGLEDGWVLVRASGTEPIIRVTAEARTPGRANEIVKKAVKILRAKSGK